MKTEKKKPIVLLILIAIVVIATFYLVGLVIGSHNGYKKGQIDSFNGKLKYEQVVNCKWIHNGYYPSGDTTYVRINE